MKFLVSLNLILSGALCFAGAEDHAQNQVCYSLEARDVAKLAVSVPTEICFETLTIDVSNVKPTISVFSYFEQHASVLRGLKLTSLVRTTEDFFSYSAETVLYQQPERHCEDGLKLTLNFQGDVDFNGDGDIWKQSLILIQETKADICHSRAQVETFNYVRR